MRGFKSKNPILSSVGSLYSSAGSSKMTATGTIIKTLIALIFVVLGAYLSWDLYLLHKWHKAMWIGSGVAAFVVAMLIAYKKTWATWLTIVYGFLKGLFLGGISAHYNVASNGIVVMAVMLSLAVMFVMLLLYKTGFIKVSRKFRSILISITTTIMLIYFVSFILRIFDLPPIPYIHESGWIGITFSSIVVVIAALNFLLDFQFIERGTDKRYPKYMEWYGAFGLLVTIIWQYLSLLRLLRKLTRFRNDW